MGGSNGASLLPWENFRGKLGPVGGTSPAGFW